MVLRFSPTDIMSANVPLPRMAHVVFTIEREFTTCLSSRVVETADEVIIGVYLNYICLARLHYAVCYHSYPALGHPVG